MSGVSTVNLSSVSIADEVIVNRDGTTARMGVKALAAQVRAEAPSGPSYPTRAALYADLGWPADAIGMVWADDTEAYRGQYRKTGASGAGAWTRFADLPQTSLTNEQLAAKADQTALAAEVAAREAAEGTGMLIRLINAAGDGQTVTADIPAATGHVALAARQIVAVYWPAANTGADPVLTIGGVSRTIRRRDGSALAAGDLQAAYHQLHVHSAEVFRHMGTLASDMRTALAPELTKLAGVQEGAQVNAVASVAGKTGAVALVKADVGLGNVDNTPDASKPVSTAQATAIAAAVSGQAEASAAEMAAQARNGDVISLVDVGGTANAVTASLPASHAGVVLAAGSMVNLVALSDNTGPATVTLAGATYTLRTHDGSDLPAGAMRAGLAYTYRVQGAAAMRAMTPRRVDELLETGSAKILTAAERAKLAGVQEGAQVNTVASVAGKTGTVALVKSDVGLGNVDNTPDASKPVSTAQAAAIAAARDRASHTGTQPVDTLTETVEAKILTAAERSKLAGVQAGAQVNAVASVAGKTGAVALVKADVGLGNVDNTPDADKPVSTAQAAAIAVEATRAGMAEAQIGAGLRPGDFAQAYGPDLTGPMSATLPFAPADVVVDPQLGAAVQVTTATHCAPRQPVALEPGRVYQARWAVRRAMDPTDPAGDAVEIGVRWLIETQAGIAGGAGNQLVDTVALTSAMGLVQRSATFALDVGGVDHVIPAAARYARPWLRCYGADHVTAIGRVSIEDVTDAWIAARDAAAGLATKAPLASPEFTGTPRVPTAAPGTNTAQAASTAFVKAALEALIAAAPAALDTLNELAAALANDPNFATTVTNALAAKAPLASPGFTGVPTAPTAAPGSATTQLANTAHVAAAIAALIDAAPGQLDTLKKLATALGNDPLFAASVSTALAAKAPLASPEFTGTPTAPTAAPGTRTAQVATTAHVAAAVDARVRLAAGAGVLAYFRASGRRVVGVIRTTGEWLLPGLELRAGSLAHLLRGEADGALQLGPLRLRLRPGVGLLVSDAGRRVLAMLDAAAVWRVAGGIGLGRSITLKPTRAPGHLALVSAADGQVIGRLTEQLDWQVAPRSGAAIAAETTMLSNLRDPLTSVWLVLLGDSITWGLTATGIAASTPRAQQLSDVRNNLTSPTWANLLRKWLAAVGIGTTAAITELAPGCGGARQMQDIDPLAELRCTVTTARGPDKLRRHVAGTVFGSTLELGQNETLRVPVTGDDIRIVHRRMTGDPAASADITLDGVAHGSFVHGGATAALGQEAAVAMPYGAHVIEITNRSPQPLQIEAVRHNRLIRVDNHGIIGSNTLDWVPGAQLLNATSVPAGVDRAILQIGTNDRAGQTESQIYEGLRATLGWLRGRGVRCSLAVANAMPPSDADPANAGRDMALIARVTARLAAEFDVPVIDHYAATAADHVEGTTILADLLHPNDTGHRAMFRNLMSSILSERL